MYPSKPTLSYEQAAETAEELYEEYRKKQKAFEDRYGGLENPELYYGWKQRGDELAELKERYGKMLSYMDRHYMEMEVEPTFTFSGTAADVTPYQQQIGQMLMELEDYVSASKGLPDPNYVRQQQTNIARLQAALDTLPAEAPGEEMLLQVLGGNYYDKVTAGGTAAQIGLGLSGLDLPMDLRDLSYDLTHLRTTPWQQTALDALAILPVVGSLKYADEAAELAQAGRRVDDLAETGEVVADTAKAIERVVDSADEVVDSIDDLEYNHRIDLNARDMEGLWRDRIAELPSEIDELYNRGWREITPSQMSENSTSRLFVNDKSGLTIRFDEGKTEGSGYGKVDHYHVFNPNSTGKGDYYLDCHGNPVPKNSKASHIIP